MKKIAFLFVLLLFSCEKSVEENCFNENDAQNSSTEKKIYTAEEIIRYKPGYLQITHLKNIKTFKKDSLDHAKLDLKNAELKYQDFKETFNNQFSYISYYETNNTKFAIAENNLGFWLLKISGRLHSAMFMGISFSQFHINSNQELPLIRNEYLQFEGSLVQIKNVPDLPTFHSYTLLKDQILFKIKLEDLERDSDNDGYNDVFEKSFGLNPIRKDSDGDGLDDLEDMNPLFISEQSKYSKLYEEIWNGTFTNFQPHPANTPFTFSTLETDCEYFQKINSKTRVLILPENFDKKTAYLQVTNVCHEGISKLKRNKNNPERFYFEKYDSGSITTYAAEFKNGKWLLEIIGEIVK